MGHEAIFGVCLDAPCVTPDVVKCDGQQYEHHDESQPPPRSEWHIGNVLRDQHAEGIDAGTGPADAVRHPDHGHSDNRVHAHGETHRDDDRYERHVLLAHADCEGTDAEQHQATRDQQPGILPKLVYCAMQSRVDRTRLAQNRNHAADYED